MLQSSTTLQISLDVFTIATKDVFNLLVEFLVLEVDIVNISFLVELPASPEVLSLLLTGITTHHNNTYTASSSLVMLPTAASVGSSGATRYISVSYSISLS